MKIDELRSYGRILLVGYGVEGKASHEFLKKFTPEIQVGIADQKDDPNYLDKQKDYDLAIRSPGVRKELIWMPYTTATNIFFANVKGKVIGITGSKGKSTTASLIHSILTQAGYKSHLCGNIGKPALDALMESNRSDDIFVFELSSFQLDDIQYSPHISVILNLFPEHLDYHPSLKSYFEAKIKILSKVTSEDYFVYNPKYEELVNLARETKAKAFPFINKLPFSQKIIPLIGEHNKENVKAAVTAASLLRVTPRDIAFAIKNFKPLPHRLEKVGTFKGLTFYDDAIATTPEATICAIKALPNIGTLFLGGLDRGYDFSELARIISTKNIPNVVLFPDSGKRILNSLEKIPNKPKILETSSMGEAVKFAYENSPKNSIVLLSAASPSYSLWKNFEEKGNQFQHFAKKIGSQMRASLS